MMLTPGVGVEAGEYCPFRLYTAFISDLELVEIALFIPVNSSSANGNILKKFVLIAST